MTPLVAAATAVTASINFTGIVFFSQWDNFSLEETFVTLCQTNSVFIGTM